MTKEGTSLCVNTYNTYFNLAAWTTRPSPCGY